MASSGRAKQLISVAVKVAITIVVVVCIVSRLGWESIARTTAMADPLWLAAAVLVFAASGVLGVVQWRILLANRGVSLSFGRCLVLYFIGMFFNNFMLGMVAGDAVRVAYVKRSNGSARGGLAATFLDRFAGLWAMAGFAIAGSLVLLKRGLLDGGRLTTAVLALAGTFLLFCGVCAFMVSRRVQGLSFALLDRIPVPGRESVRAMLKAIVFEAGNRHVVVPVGALSAVVQFMRIGVHLLCAAALGLLTAANYQYFFVFVPILAILMLIPLPFGVKEGVGGSMFVLAGFSPEAPEAPMVMEFLAALVGIVASLAGGVFFVMSRVSTNQSGKPA